MATATPQASSSTALPENVSVNNFVAMTPDDLRSITQAVIRAQQHAQNPTGNEKDLKFAEPTSFTGKPEDLDPMVREAELRFSVLQRTYDTPTKKAFYILSLFNKEKERPSAKEIVGHNSKEFLPKTSKTSEAKTMPWPYYKPCDKDETL